MTNPDADLAEFLLAQSKRELVRHPLSPAIVSPRVAKDIDLSGIFRMTPDEIDAAILAEAAA
jgi:hypothetical protein